MLVMDQRRGQHLVRQLEEAALEEPGNHARVFDEIGDFVSRTDRISISADGFGGGLFAGGDVSLVSGANRADEARLAEAVGEPIERPDAAYVREITGYSIGGIPPIGHPRPLRTVLDEDLLGFDPVWAAAGHPHAVFPIAPDALVRATGARVTALRPGAAPPASDRAS